MSLPMYCSCRRRASCFVMRRACSTAYSKFSGNRDRSELFRVEPDQALAEGLKLVHGALALGLAGLFLVLHVPGNQ